MASVSSEGNVNLLQDLQHRIAKRQQDSTPHKELSEKIEKSNNHVRFASQDDQQQQPSQQQQQQQNSSSSKKGKTKAKQRYLKNKAARRKQRLREVKNAAKRQNIKDKNIEYDGNDSDSSSSSFSSDNEDDDGNDKTKNNKVEEPIEEQADDSSLNIDKKKEKKDKKKEEKSKKRKADQELDHDQGKEEEEKEQEIEISKDEKREKKEKKEKKKQKKLKKKEDAEEEKIEIEPSETTLDNQQEESEEKETKQQEQEQEQQAQQEPAALERFPAIQRPQRPSQSALAQLAVSSEMPDSSAHVVQPSVTVPLESLSPILSSSSSKKLQNAGITNLFAVQSVVIPRLLKGKSSDNKRLRDLCVSAPTGSGKTLAYALPLVESLKSRIIVRLRALIVLPTRDLVVQLRETLQWLMKGTDLKLGVAMGQHSLSKEQATLTNSSPSDPSQSSKVDILIATPGRLIEHLKSTPNFTLQHLQYLIIDEADRLLQQSFQDWLIQVLTSIRTTKDGSSDFSSDKFTSHDPAEPESTESSSNTNKSYRPISTSRIRDPTTHVQKLLFSATLTRDPSKIAELKLYRPAFIAVRDSSSTSNNLDGVSNGISDFTVPELLQQHYIVSPASSKPLALFHLLHNVSIRNVLTFTKSVESASRLVKLIEFFEQAQISNKPIHAKVYSSDMTHNERSKILKSFKDGEFQVLVCSDLISRGIDLPDVDHVVNYDAPIDPRKYVHRVGRTARAGKKGDSWTLVESQEASFFKNMLKDAGLWDKLNRMRMSKENIEPFEEPYNVSLSHLKKFYNPESND